MPDGKAAAFFDVDNTLVRGATLFYLAREMREQHVFSGREVRQFVLRQLSFSWFGENLDHVASVRERAMSLAEGLDVLRMEGLMADVYDGVISRKLWPGTRRLVLDHLAAGRDVWLVSATPGPLARLIAARLGLTGAVGTEAESRDGRYTGRLVGDINHGPAKGLVVRGLAARYGYDLAECWAYSDSRNDLPMLEAVGHPAAVNPDRALRRRARSEGWPVFDFRRARRAAWLGVRGAAGIGALWAGRRAWRSWRR